MKKTVNGNTVEYTVNGVLRKIVVLSTTSHAERYAKGDLSVKPIDIQTVKNGKLVD